MFSARGNLTDDAKHLNADRLVSPSYFKRYVSSVASAQICFGAVANLPKPKGAAARLGVRFEKRVVSALSKRFGGRFAAGLPISFCEISGGFYQRPSTAIPDGLLLSADRRSICIIEVKLRHREDAWSQLNRFYLPILRKVTGDSFFLRTLEICAYYDPGVRLPAKKEVLVDIEEAFTYGPSTHPVLIWERRP
jgi:hypothetical protein